MVGLDDEVEGPVKNLPVLLVFDKSLEEGGNPGDFEKAVQGQKLLLQAGDGGYPGRTGAKAPSIEAAGVPNLPPGQKFVRKVLGVKPAVPKREPADPVLFDHREGPAERPECRIRICAAQDKVLSVRPEAFFEGYSPGSGFGGFFLLVPPRFPEGIEDKQSPGGREPFGSGPPNVGPAVGSRFQWCRKQAR